MGEKKTTTKKPAVKKTEKAIAKKPVSKKPVVDEHRGLKAALLVILMCLWVFVSIVAAQFVIGMIMVTLLGTERMNQTMWTAVYSALSYIVAGLLIIFVPAKIVETQRKNKKKVESKSFWKDLGIFGWLTWTDIGLAIAGVIVAVVLASALTGLFELFPWFNTSETQDVGFNFLANSLDRVIAYITLAVIAPIAEETIFRGWLYGKIRDKLNFLPEWGNIIISIFVVSLLFGIVHMQWNVGVVVFSLSVVMCALREITGTIYAGILMHIIWNTIAFYQLYVL